MTAGERLTARSTDFSISSPHTVTGNALYSLPLSVRETVSSVGTEELSSPPQPASSSAADRTAAVIKCFFIFSPNQ